MTGLTNFIAHMPILSVVTFLPVVGALFILFMQSDRPDGPPFHCAMDAMRRI